MTTTETASHAKPIRGAKAVPCPVCEAQPGQSCLGSATSPFARRRGSRAVQSHRARVAAARSAREG